MLKLNVFTSIFINQKLTYNFIIQLKTKQKKLSTFNLNKTIKLTFFFIAILYLNVFELFDIINTHIIFFCFREASVIFQMNVI